MGNYFHSSISMVNLKIRQQTRYNNLIILPIPAKNTYTIITNWRKLKKYLPKASIFSSVPLNKCNGVEKFPPAGC